MKLILLIIGLLMVLGVQAASASAVDAELPMTPKLKRLIQCHELKSDGEYKYNCNREAGKQYADSKQLIFIDEAEEGERVQPTSKAEMLKLEKAEYDKRK